MSLKNLFKSKHDPSDDSTLIKALRNAKDEKAALSSMKKILKNPTLDIDYVHYEALTDDSYSALYVAASKGWMKVIKTLLKFGAKIDIQCTTNEWTALFIAVYSGNVIMTNYLLENGAQINYIDKTGWTPLFVGANEGKSEVLSILLERGANCLIENEEGKTAYAYAKNPQIKEIFEKHIESNKGKDLIIDNLEKEIKELKKLVESQQAFIMKLQTKTKTLKKEELPKSPILKRRKYKNFYMGSKDEKQPFTTL